MRVAAWAGREGALAAAITLPVLAVRIAFGWQNTFCGTPDACNYLGVAQSLAAGRGLETRFIFNLQQDVLTLPTHSIEYWRPGTGFLLLLAKPFGGVCQHSGMVVATLAVILLAAAAWALAMRATGSRRVALASYLLCLLLPPSWAESLTTDSGVFYGLSVAWFLVLFTVRRRSLVADIGALLMVALTYSIRNDGILLLLPLMAVLWQRNRNGSTGSSATYAAAMLVGFLMAMAPMHILNYVVLGHAFPAGAGRALYIGSFDDFMHYRQPVNLHTLLAAGPAHLLWIRLVTFASVLYRNAALGIGFAVVFLPALWFERRSPGLDTDEKLPELTGGVAFVAAVLVMYTAVMPVIGEFSALRALYGLLPLASVLVVVAVMRLSRDQRMAQMLMTTVLAVYLVDGIMADRRGVKELAAIGTPMQLMGRELVAAGIQQKDAVLMTDDSIQVAVTTGYATVPLPSNGDTAVHAFAHDIGVTHMLVYPGYPVPLVQRIRSALRPEREMLLPQSRVLVMELKPPVP